MNQITPIRFDALPAGGMDRLRGILPGIELAAIEDDLVAIERLKRERRAVILAHNYQTPDIFHGVADIVGDSLLLAREAARSDAEIILVAGVHFMGETAKLLNPDRTVLVPDHRAGCSLAESITADDVRALRVRHPGVPVVTYVNTSAAVKAESDICCTSGNAVRVVESLGVPEVLMIPDEFLARNVARQTSVRIIPWSGHCEVHERFTPAEVRQFRADHPGVVVLAHPECPPEVVDEADFSGSTAEMQEFVGRGSAGLVLLLTECSMSDNVAALNPETRFVRPCNLCPHMKRITLSNIRSSLETLSGAIEIEPELAARARRSVERMLDVR